MFFWASQGKTASRIPPVTIWAVVQPFRTSKRATRKTTMAMIIPVIRSG